MQRHRQRTILRQRDRSLPSTVAPLPMRPLPKIHVSSCILGARSCWDALRGVAIRRRPERHAIRLTLRRSPRHHRRSGGGLHRRRDRRFRRSTFLSTTPPQYFDPTRTQRPSWRDKIMAVNLTGPMRLTSRGARCEAQGRGRIIVSSVGSPRQARRSPMRLRRRASFISHDAWPWRWRLRRWSWRR